MIKGDLYSGVTAFDLESNKVTESYIEGNVFLWKEDYSLYDARTIIQPWENAESDRTFYYYQKNHLFINSITNANDFQFSPVGEINFSKKLVENYINFDRLYNNVVAEQSGIEEGKKMIARGDGVLHLPIGGSYTIEDINEINEIVFDNFDENKDKLTIITVKNSGDVSFPLISRDTGGYKGIVTNDRFGKTQATHFYEQDTFVQDSYYGNIVWNVPNATFIELKENAPFAGHLIAPNADVNTPELHFAGCFIVNSIYGEGNTEAHFYPITVELDCDCQEYYSLSEPMKKKFADFRLDKLLGGDSSIVETTIVGDESAYQEEVATLEHVLSRCPSNNIDGSIDNPGTYRDFGIVILIIITIGLGISIYKNKKLEK